ncbi:MAG: protein kinase [Planctomycetaceae bacterium]|nr:protein kinase [Planctomycetaceae bacterium]
MALTRDEFLNRLRDARVLPEADWLKLAATLPASLTDGEAVARELVKQRQLTAFQAQQIFAGRGQSLVLGNYVITDKLGQGGMGMVLKAEHRVMKRVVALKVLSPALVKTSELRQRFQREVHAAARLSHHNIVTAFDADEAGGIHYLVMEFVAGRDLASLVKDRGPLPAAQALPLIRQVAEGLQYAHEQGIVHRDIKPANLLLAADGTVKILDMGLARFSDSNSNESGQADLTSTGAVMGTVDYMSPEQALNTKHADERADIYSLGCTLYFLLTGQPLYPGETLMEKIVAHREAAIPRIAPASGVDQGQASVNWNDVNALFARMVAKQPDRRFASMSEVISALKAVASGVPVMAGIGLLGADQPLSRPADSPETRYPDLAMATAPSLNLPTAVEPSIASRVRSRQSPKSTNRFPLISAGVVVLVALSSLPFLFQREKPSAPVSAPVVKVIEAAAPIIDDPSSETWPAGTVDETWQGIVSHPRAVPGLRRWQYETIAPRGLAKCLSVAPVGNRFLVGSDDRRWRIYRWSKDGIELEQLIPMEDGSTIHGYDAKWSPDGRWLALGVQLAKEIVTFDTQERRFGPRYRCLASETETGAVGGWNPDGTLLATGGVDENGAGIFLWSWPDGKLVRKIIGFDDPPYLIAWSHDGQYLAGATRLPQVQIWSVSGEAGPVLSGLKAHALAWNPTRPALAVRALKWPENEIHERILDAKTGVLLERRGTHTLYPVLEWTHDGGELLVTADDYTMLAIAPGHENPRRTEINSDGEVAAPRPGKSELVIVRGGTTQVVNAQNGSVTATLGGFLRKGAWSADGNSLIGLTEGSGLVVHDVPRNQLVGTIASVAGEINEVIWNRKHELLHSGAWINGKRVVVSAWNDSGQRRHSMRTDAATYTRFVSVNDGRLLLESHYLFSLQDPERNFAESPVGIPMRHGMGVIGFVANPRNNLILVEYSGTDEQGGNGAEIRLGRLGEASFELIPGPADSYSEGIFWNNAGDRFAIKWIGRSNGKVALELWEPSKPTRLISTMEGPRNVRFSPDDQQMLLDDSPGFVLARAADLESRYRFQVARNFSYPRHSQPWSPDGQATALIGLRGNADMVHLVDPLSGYAHQSLPLHSGTDTAWNPRTGLLIASSQGGLLRCWRAGAKESHPRWTAVQLSPEDFATFSPGGDLLHASTNAARQFVVMTETEDGVLAHEPLDAFRARVSPSP